MKGKMYVKKLCCCLPAFILLCFSLFGQRGESGNQTRQPEDEIYLCLDKDFYFEFQGQTIGDNGKIYVCPKRLPDTIYIYDLSNNLVTQSTTWTGAQPVASSPAKALLRISDFTSDKHDVLCSFTDANGNPHTLTIKFNKNLSLEYYDLGTLTQFYIKTGDRETFKFASSDILLDQLGSEYYNTEHEAKERIDTHMIENYYRPIVRPNDQISGFGQQKDENAQNGTESSQNLAIQIDEDDF